MGWKEPSTLLARLLLLCPHFASELIVWTRSGCCVSTCRQLATWSCCFDIFRVIFVWIVAKFAWTSLITNFDRLANLTRYTVATGVCRHPLLDKLLMEIRSRFVETEAWLRLELEVDRRVRYILVAPVGYSTGFKSLLCVRPWEMKRPKHRACSIWWRFRSVVCFFVGLRGRDKLLQCSNEAWFVSIWRLGRSHWLSHVIDLPYILGFLARVLVHVCESSFRLKITGLCLCI